MAEAFYRLQEICLRLWRPWSADPAEREGAEFTATALFALWLASIPVAAWMAIGNPPGVLAGAAGVLLWALGSLYLFVLGLPPLAAHAFRRGLANPQALSEGGKQAAPVADWEAGYDASVTRVEELKAKGALPQDYELAPRQGGAFANDVNRAATDRPTLRMIAKIAGLILIVALIVGKQPLLATFYALPPLGWLALGSLDRRRFRGQGT